MAKKPKTRRPTYVISTFLYFLCHLFLYLLPETQNPSNLHYIVSAFFCVSMSFGFSIYYTGILASIPSIVPEKSVGTAFGVIGCVVGLSQCITPFINIGIIDSD
jgi:MFS family permease